MDVIKCPITASTLIPSVLDFWQRNPGFIFYFFGILVLIYKKEQKTDRGGIWGYTEGNMWAIDKEGAPVIS